MIKYIKVVQQYNLYIFTEVKRALFFDSRLYSNVIR